VREVFVELNDGRTLRGVVSAADATRLMLERRIAGGSAVLPIQRDEVERVLELP